MLVIRPFLGLSGRGKSTLAVSFACEGFRFLTDDALFISRSEDDYWVTPGDHSVRLWSDSEQAVLRARGNRLPAVSYTKKDRFVLKNIDLVAGSRRLRVACFLGDGSSDSVSR